MISVLLELILQSRYPLHYFFFFGRSFYWFLYEQSHQEKGLTLQIMYNISLSRLEFIVKAVSGRLLLPASTVFFFPSTQKIEELL